MKIFFPYLLKKFFYDVYTCIIYYPFLSMAAKITEAQKERILRMILDGKNDSQIAKIVKMNKFTILRFRRRIKSREQFIRILGLVEKCFFIK